MLREHELAELLRAWIAPTITESLDRRLAHSFLSCFPVNSNLERPHTWPAELEVFMKTCTACEEQFEDKFSFCPVDGTPLNSLAAALAGYSTQDRSSSTTQESQLLRPHFPGKTISISTDNIEQRRIAGTTGSGIAVSNGSVEEGLA